MRLPGFLLDQWLAKYEFREPPVAFNLASSTGPSWSLRDLLAMPGATGSMNEIRLGYAPPDGSRELRSAIGEHHGVDPDWVVVTTGASEALSILFCLFSEPGASVVLPRPAFPAFEAMAGAWRLDVSRYELRRSTGFSQTADGVLEAVDEQSVLALVNTPHNPTGSVMVRGEIERLAAALRARNIPLIVDEVYHPLYFAGDNPSAANIENVIVIGDMSKALSLAGLRVGWIIDADADRRKRIIDARSYFTISGSPLSEAIAAHALRNREAVLRRLHDVASANLALLKPVLDGASDIVSWVVPDGGTIAYPWFKDGRDSRPFCEALADDGVLVVPGDCYGEPAHVRIGLGAQSAGFDNAVKLLEAAISR